MTISRSDRIDTERLSFQCVSSNDPDLIGIEVTIEGNLLIEVSMDEHGQTSVVFDSDKEGSMEFDLGSLRGVLDRCEAELSAWRGRILEPGQTGEVSK